MFRIKDQQVAKSHLTISKIESPFLEDHFDLGDQIVT